MAACVRLPGQVLYTFEMFIAIYFAYLHAKAHYGPGLNSSISSQPKTIALDQNFVPFLS